MKKFLSVILSLVIALGACLSASLTIKSNAATVDDLTFTLNEDGQSYYVKRCNTSASGELEIPNMYNDLPVTMIASQAFLYCNLLTSVIIPDNITSIGDSAFWECTSLTKITIGKGVTSLSASVFKCSEDLVFIVTDNVYVVNYLEKNNFNYVFNKTGLFLFELNEDEESYSIVGHNITTETEIEIPATYNDLPVTSIGDSAFYNCSSLVSVTIPSSVISVGDLSFAGCQSLTSIKLGESMKNIGAGAFSYCTALTTVTIPDSVTSIGAEAFSFCYKLNSVTIGRGLTQIGPCAFGECGALTEVHITDIANWCNMEFSSAFDTPWYYGAKGNLYLEDELVTNLVIPEGVTEIKQLVFEGFSSIRSVTIPDSVTSIGANAFKKCTNLSTVFISDLNSWSNIDFENADANPMCYADDLYLNNKLLTDIVIPEGITEIKKYAFYNCSTLESVTIPESVTSIGDSAFAKCVQLKKVNISDIEKWCNITFASSTANPLSNSAGLYLDDKIIRNVILPETLTEVKAYTFNGNIFLKSVKLPDTIEKIGTSAFCNCINLELLVLSENLTDIGGSAFKGCKSLETVTIPKSLKNIGSTAFDANDALKYVFYPGSMLEWNEIAIGGSNFTTSDLVIHYNSTDHTYMEVINEPIFEGVEGTREEVCKICGHVGKEEKIEVINTYLAGVTEFDVALDAPTNYLVANISASKDLNESIVVMDGYTLTTTPNSDFGYYGTGSKVQVLDDNGVQVDEYTLVVRGDVNGDSVCDVLDCMLIELARNNHKELDGVYLSAGDLTENGEIDVYDFEAVVNKVVA